MVLDSMLPLQYTPWLLVTRIKPQASAHGMSSGQMNGVAQLTHGCWDEQPVCSYPGRVHHACKSSPCLLGHDMQLWCSTMI